MVMILYGGSLSPFVARVALAARFKGMKYVLTAPPGGSKSPEYLSMNPLGKVPALKDGATIICESAVIVEYLEAKGKTKKLVPKSAKAAAIARQIGAVAGEYIQGAARKLLPFLREPVENPQAVEDRVAELGKYLDILEKMMPKGKYAAGSRFSIADVYVAPTLFFVLLVTGQLRLTDPIASRPKLKKYLATMQKDKTAGGILRGMAAEWRRLMED